VLEAAESLHCRHAAQQVHVYVVSPRSSVCAEQQALNPLITHSAKVNLTRGTRCPPRGTCSAPGSSCWSTTSAVFWGDHMAPHRYHLLSRSFAVGTSPLCLLEGLRDPACHCCPMALQSTQL